jgi:hypothetical protein
MDAFYFSIGGLVFAIALFKRELLVRKDRFRLILGISSVLFLAGITIHFMATGQDSAHGALLVPLISLGLYRLCYKIFVAHFRREPRDTWLNWAEGMAADRLFNIVYFVSAFWCWMLVTIFMSALAKRGW